MGATACKSSACCRADARRAPDEGNLPGIGVIDEDYPKSPSKSDANAPVFVDSSHAHRGEDSSDFSPPMAAPMAPPDAMDVQRAEQEQAEREAAKVKERQDRQREQKEREAKEKKERQEAIAKAERDQAERDAAKAQAIKEQADRDRERAEQEAQEAAERRRKAGFPPGSKLEINLDGKWTPVSDEEKRQIENNMAGGEVKFTIQARGTMYLVDFSDPKKPKQSNAMTKKSRDLRVVK